MTNSPDDPEGISEGQMVAAVDLGSNSFHMIVARYHHGELQTIDRLKDMVRLAAGLDAQGRLDTEVQDRALATLARFGQRLAGLQHQWVRAVGTNTLRRLHPKRAFLLSAETALGHPIDIISGQDEARLIYHGVYKGLADQGRQRLIIDIGGGSTEVIIGRAGVPVLLESLPFGCVRVSGRFFADGKITPQRWKAAVTAVELELQGIADTYREVGWEEVIGSSGTAISVAEVAREVGLCDRWLTADAVRQLSSRIVDCERIENIRFKTLSSQRQPVFAGGLAIVQACFNSLGIEELHHCGFALREGLLYDMIGQIETGSDPREQTIAATLRRFAVDEKQAGRVEAVTNRLFAAVRDTWKLSANAGKLLRFASLCHEIGLTISHSGYQAHGGYLLANADLPGFSRLEQNVISIMVRNHRRRLNACDFDELPERIADTAKKLTALLRIGVLMHRARTTRAGPDIRAMAINNTLHLAFPNRWLSDHPLTAADLEQETQALQKIGIQLKTSNGSDPTETS